MNEEIKETIRAFKLAKMFPFRKLKISRKNVKILSNYINNIEEQNTELKDNWNKLKEWLEEEIKENDTTIKKCDQIIFKMGNENRKDTHQHKLIDVCSRESLVFNKVLSKMQEIEGGMNE